MPWSLVRDGGVCISVRVLNFAAIWMQKCENELRHYFCLLNLN